MQRWLSLSEPPRRFRVTCAGCKSNTGLSDGLSTPQVCAAHCSKHATYIWHSHCHLLNAVLDQWFDRSLRGACYVIGTSTTCMHQSLVVARCKRPACLRMYLIAQVTTAMSDVQIHCVGHSLGGFTAASCAILNTHICHCTTFEAPGLTTFYHKLASELGNSHFWNDRITNYVTIPNPINMCQKHLGEVYRVYTRTEYRTDFLHVFKCLFGSSVRTMNWLLLANVLITAVRLLMGGVTAFTACAEALATQRSWATFKVTLPSSPTNSSSCTCSITSL